ncbi:hypothetical protein Ciccas_004610 [Cichlidogyrus casuarinus]|uniref:HTH CENPB-type domain-containing protein n=1 Tax=Cichlidogyrus casuarinus TaxID=1844966 RepID=A0ABD2QB08_9PLAT
MSEEVEINKEIIHKGGHNLISIKSDPDAAYNEASKSSNPVPVKCAPTSLVVCDENLLENNDESSDASSDHDDSSYDIDALPSARMLSRLLWHVDYVDKNFVAIDNRRTLNIPFPSPRTRFNLPTDPSDVKTLLKNVPEPNNCISMTPENLRPSVLLLTRIGSCMLKENYGGMNEISVFTRLSGLDENPAKPLYIKPDKPKQPKKSHKVEPIFVKHLMWKAKDDKYLTDDNHADDQELTRSCLTSGCCDIPVSRILLHTHFQKGHLYPKNLRIILATLRKKRPLSQKAYSQSNKMSISYRSSNGWCAFCHKKPPQNLHLHYPREHHVQYWGDPDNRTKCDYCGNYKIGPSQETTIVCLPMDTLRSQDLLLHHAGLVSDSARSLDSHTLTALMLIPNPKAFFNFPCDTVKRRVYRYAAELLSHVEESDELTPSLLHALSISSLYGVLKQNNTSKTCSSKLVAQKTKNKEIKIPTLAEIQEWSKLMYNRNNAASKRTVVATPTPIEPKRVKLNPTPMMQVTVSRVSPSKTFAMAPFAPRTSNITVRAPFHVSFKIDPTWQYAMLLRERGIKKPAVPGQVAEAVRKIWEVTGVPLKSLASIRGYVKALIDTSSRNISLTPTANRTEAWIESYSDQYRKLFSGVAWCECFLDGKTWQQCSCRPAMKTPTLADYDFLRDQASYRELSISITTTTEGSRKRYLRLASVATASKLTPSIVAPRSSIASSTQMKSTMLLCELCSKYQSNADTMASHMRLVHNLTGSPKFDCPVCNNNFYTQAGYENHRNVVCPIKSCSVTFSCLYSLHQHVPKSHAFLPSLEVLRRKSCPAYKTHDDEGSFLCSTCDLVFIGWQKYLQHLNERHANDQPLKLPEKWRCDQEKHEAKLYHCFLCPKVITFSDMFKFWSHKLDKHAEPRMNSIDCPLCKRSFAVCTAYIDHLKVAHATEVFYSCPSDVAEGSAEKAEEDDDDVIIEKVVAAPVQLVRKSTFVPIPVAPAVPIQKNIIVCPPPVEKTKKSFVLYLPKPVSQYFHCKLCDLFFLNTDSVSEHNVAIHNRGADSVMKHGFQVVISRITKRSEKQIYLCVDCRSELENEEAFLEHVSNSREKCLAPRPHFMDLCDLCDMFLADEQTVSAHMMVYHKKKYPNPLSWAVSKCRFCHKVAYDEISLRNHQFVRCPFCSAMVGCLYLLNIHVIIHHRLLNICASKLRSLENARFNAMDRVNRCPHCSDVFQGKAFFWNHVLHQHRDTNRFPNLNSSGIYVNCTACTKTLHSVRELIYHMDYDHRVFVDFVNNGIVPSKKPLEMKRLTLVPAQHQVVVSSSSSEADAASPQVATTSNNKEELNILDEFATGTFSQRELAKKHKCYPNTIRMLLAREEVVRARASSGLSKKHKRSAAQPTYAEVDERTLDFVKQKVSQGINLSYEDIRVHALRVADEIGDQTFGASNGWLHSFLNRYDLKISIIKETSPPLLDTELSFIPDLPVHDSDFSDDE